MCDALILIRSHLDLAFRVFQPIQYLQPTLWQSVSSIGSNMRNTWSSWQTRSCDYWSEFQCKNGQCINRSEVCDTHHHCHDGSDEDYCNSTG